jgi:hypothetical protein
MKRRLLAAALIAVTLAGCYGSTEPATDVGPESATLRGHGTANDGPAVSWFEYSLTGSERDPLKVGTQRWPAGASGPISAKATHLTAGRSHSFRLCGYDDKPEGIHTICAQTRTFTTQPAAEDSLWGGFFAGCCSRIDVDARSGPNGANSRGSVRWYASSSSSPDPPRTFNGFVTCLAVDGSRAAVGAVGKWTQQGSPDANATLLITVVDGRTEEDTYHGVETAGSALPNCATASFANQNTLLDPQADFVVNDATS